MRCSSSCCAPRGDRRVRRAARTRSAAWRPSCGRCARCRCRSPGSSPQDATRRSKRRSSRTWATASSRTCRAACRRSSMPTSALRRRHAARARAGVLLQTSPSFSLRGGTREILRGIIAQRIGVAMMMPIGRTHGRMLADTPRPPAARQRGDAGRACPRAGTPSSGRSSTRWACRCCWCPKTHGGIGGHWDDAHVVAACARRARGRPAGRRGDAGAAAARARGASTRRTGLVGLAPTAVGALERDAGARPRALHRHAATACRGGGICSPSLAVVEHGRALPA